MHIFKFLPNLLKFAVRQFGRPLEGHRDTFMPKRIFNTKLDFLKTCKNAHFLILILSNFAQLWC